jgi:putative transposase
MVGQTKEPSLDGKEPLMNKRTRKQGKKQTQERPNGVVNRVGQILLPMIAGIASTKQGLTEWVYEKGLETLDKLLREDAEEVAGPKGKHRQDRTHYHWGRTNGELSFGGRRIQVSRPRVRSKSGEESLLPHFEAFREQDPLSERVVKQILVGVSTRGYESSLEKPVARLKSRGTSKSAASRHLVTQTSKKLKDYLSRRLEELKLAALMVDGLEVAGHTVVVSLGITIDGTKVPLGLWLGSTENSRLCTAMLQELVDRGLRIDGQILCVIDGGKGIRKALDDVFGDLALIQRCHLHKLRNLQAHLPMKRYAYARQTMREAYRSTSADKARKRLQSLVSWLERNGYDEAAGSLREGMEQTLTVIKLGLPESLRKSLATTNAIENLIGTIRRVSRNVKRWRGPSMIRRWTALGVVTAEKRFRRIKGYRHMNDLCRALKSKEDSLDSVANVA